MRFWWKKTFTKWRRDKDCWCGLPIILCWSRTSGFHIYHWCLCPYRHKPCTVKASSNLVCLHVWLLTGAVLPACSWKFSPESQWGLPQDWTHPPQLYKSGDELQVSYTQLSIYIMLVYLIHFHKSLKQKQWECTCRRRNESYTKNKLLTVPAVK